MPHRGSRGFSLIELLVVIVMISILAAILFPVIKTAQDNARRSACVSNLQQIAQGVELARGEGLGYPAMPNFAGKLGIPQDGVTGLAQTESGFGTNYFWCQDDLYPEELIAVTSMSAAEAGLLRDTTGSSYSNGYNYYGYVTTTDGMPFPITTEEAAQYFYDDPKRIDTSLEAYIKDLSLARGNTDDQATKAAKAFPNWDLGLIKDTTAKDGSLLLRPHGLFQGLWNTWAPQDTIVTFCPHHMKQYSLNRDNKGVIPVVLLNGEARLLKPVAPTLPAIDQVDVLGSWMTFVRQSDDPQISPAVDWRLNKAPFQSSQDRLIRPLPARNYSDAPNDVKAKMMPLVKTYTCRFRTDDNSDDMIFDNPDPAQKNFRWFDTQIAYETLTGLQAHDVIMISARGKWTWSTDNNHFANKSYAPLYDDSGMLWFSPDGDPVERTTNNIDEDPELRLLPNAPLGQLVAMVGTRDDLRLITAGKTPGAIKDRIGDPSLTPPIPPRIFPVKSRGFHLVLDEEDINSNSNSPATLWLALNTVDFKNDKYQVDPPVDWIHNSHPGWCEVTIAVYRPKP